MMHLIYEILSLTRKVQSEECNGCINDWPSQLDHECITNRNFNKCLLIAIDMVKNKYKIEDDMNALYDELKMDMELYLF
ncbi:unnamed protein product [Brachionus calyciflorus]|uniref:Uncharacterized protein n=1 Tax=Brachionus calyciflorus TaxID=104777 RepID=A0A814RQC1_9BILA|nr:unnamed protein product [Brachionus calyciflorus]